MVNQNTSVLFVVCLMLASAYLNPVEGLTFDKSVDKFSGHLYEDLASRKPNENVVLSGLSAHIAFSLLNLGARDETKEELTNALFIDDFEAAQPSIKEAIEELKYAKYGVTVNLANKVYAKPSPYGKLDSVASAYRSSVQDIFDSDVQQLDFSKNVEATQTMNKWVEERTDGKIKDLVDSSYIDGSISAVLVSAIRFKGKWAKKFPKVATKSEEFTRADGSIVIADFMNKNEDLLYKDDSDLDAKILQLPYYNRDAVLVIILPNQINGLASIESKLANGTSEYIKSPIKARVDVKLPKFKIETTIDLIPPLQKLGVNLAFKPTANLRGIMDDESGIHVSKAIQKAFIEVNEDGTEAAAASGVLLLRGSGVPVKLPERQFYADHSFFYAVQYKGITLFSGSFKTGAS